MALPDKKEDRQKKKAERKEKKDIKLGAQIASETEKAGIDLKSPARVGPLGSEQKAEIDKRLTEYAEEDVREGLKKFQKLYKAPDTAVPKPPSEEQLKQSLRREKRARLGDILTGLGRGFRGATVDPSQFRGSQIRKEREAQYQQYKDASKASKQRLEEWGAGYAQQQIDYLNSLKKDELSPLKKKKIEAEIDSLKALAEQRRRKPAVSGRGTKPKPIYTHQTEEGNWKITNQKNPYSDLYYKLTGNSPTIINEVAKLAGHTVGEEGTLKRNLSSDEIERFSNTLLSKAFDIQVDEQGNQLAVPKPGRENFLQDLSVSIDATNKIKAEKQRLKSEMDQEIYEAEGSSFLGIGKSKEDVQEGIRQKYETLISEADTNLQESESELKAMMGGDYNPSEKTSTQQTEDVDPWEL